MNVSLLDNEDFVIHLKNHINTYFEINKGTTEQVYV